MTDKAKGTEREFKVPAEFQQFHDLAESEGVGAVHSGIARGYGPVIGKTAERYLMYREQHEKALADARQEALFERSVAAAESATKAAKGATIAAWCALFVATMGVVFAVLTFQADHQPKEATTCKAEASTKSAPVK